MDWRTATMEEQSLWVPPHRRGRRSPGPADGTTERAPVDRNARVNTVPGEAEPAGDEALVREIARLGVVKEPEVGRVGYGELEAAYSDTYWTHFDWRSDVKASVVRTQKKFPWLTYANTYYCHPPVYGRKYEFASADFWGGGLSNGSYYGYRGKPINAVVNGWAVFDAIFDDPGLPNIYWIIFAGRMWTRGYGWGPAPWGPPDSDPGHFSHIHVTYL